MNPAGEPLFQPVACFPRNRVAARLLFLWLSTASSLALFSACAQATPTPAPTPVSTLASLPTPIAVHLPTDASPTPVSAPALPPCPHYQLEVQIDYSTHYLQVNETLVYPNQTGEPLAELVLAVLPNDWPAFMLTSLRVDGWDSTAHLLSGKRLTIPLAQPLAPGGVVTLSLRYQVSLPPIKSADLQQGRPQVFGYSPRQINLIDWYPFVVPYEAGQGWVLHPPTLFGEYLVYEVADFEVTLQFPDPNSVPVIAASGLEQPAPDQSSRRYHLEQGRAFALSLSSAFQVEAQTIGGVTVSSYYFPENQAAGQAALSVSAQALQIYTDRFGPPPHPTLSVVQGDFADGMEASAFYWLGQGYYDHYDGTPKNYLTIIAAHETAHQWWFERVGNDQLLAPWLDESLATYSERIYYETAHPDLLNWWWAYRIDRYSPVGWVDLAVTDASYYEAYRKAVYLNGAQFMETLRRRLGDEIFFAFLRAYAAEMTSRRATTADFIDLLQRQTSADFSDILSAYLHTLPR